MPEWATAAFAFGGNVIFYRRDDGKDWYDYAKAANRFGKNSVVATTSLTGDGSEQVGAIYRDASRLDPYNKRVIEILGVDPNEAKPHNLFEWLTYHADTKAFSGQAGPPQPPTVPVVTFKKDVWTRATADEVEKIDAFLNTQTIRDQRIFNDTSMINHEDPLYTALLTGFSGLFGADRATQILSAS